MQEHDKLEKKLNDYFNLAKNEEPIISVKEVVHVITGIPASKADKFNWKSYKFSLLVVVILISTSTLYVFYKNDAIKKTAVSKVEDKITVMSNVKPINQIANVVADTNLLDTADEFDQLNKIEADASMNHSKPVDKSVKNEKFFYQGNAKVHFEMDGSYIEMQINEEIIQLKIDGEIIQPENFNQYASIIEKGKMMKAESAKIAESNNNQTNNENEKNKLIMNEIISQLKKDQLVNMDSPFMFRLTGTKMYIDELEQNDSIFIEFKKLYERVSGKKLYLKSNIKIQH